MVVSIRVRSLTGPITLALLAAGSGGTAGDAATTAPEATAHATTSAALATSAPSPPTSSTAASAGSAPCLPIFRNPERIGATAGRGEAFVTAGDFDGDGDDDVLITRTEFATLTEFEIEIHLDEDGRLARSTDIFLTGAPTVQPRQGDQAGNLSSPGSLVSWTTLDPSASITKISKSPSRSDSKAMWVPSGDQAGLPSLPGSSVSWTTLLPSASIT